VADHPQYAMWKTRLEAELAAERALAARRAARDAARDGWDTAWVHYRRLWHEGLLPGRACPHGGRCEPGFASCSANPASG